MTEGYIKNTHYPILRTTALELGDSVSHLTRSPQCLPTCSNRTENSGRLVSLVHQVGPGMQEPFLVSSMQSSLVFGTSVILQMSSHTDRTHTRRVFCETSGQSQAKLVMEMRPRLLVFTLMLIRFYHVIKDLKVLSCHANQTQRLCLNYQLFVGRTVQIRSELLCNLHF